MDAFGGSGLLSDVAKRIKPGARVIYNDFDGYAQENYFNLVQFSILMHQIRPPFVLFSSTKSELINYIKYMLDYQVNNHQSFINYQRVIVNTSVSYNSEYQDNIVFKF